MTPRLLSSGPLVYVGSTVCGWRYILLPPGCLSLSAQCSSRDTKPRTVTDPSLSCTEDGESESRAHVLAECGRRRQWTMTIRVFMGPRVRDWSNTTGVRGEVHLRSFESHPTRRKEGNPLGTQSRRGRGDFSRASTLSHPPPKVRK